MYCGLSILSRVPSVVRPNIISPSLSIDNDSINVFFPSLSPVLFCHVSLYLVVSYLVRYNINVMKMAGTNNFPQ